jgi:ABC-2 type transport system permease protein
VVGALGTPLVFWVLVGAGLRDSFQISAASRPMSYLEFSYPGAIAAILLFTAIFSTISVIDDRHAGFLQGVLVSPAPRAAIALGKILGATTLAVGQALLFLLLAPLAGIKLGAASVVATIGAMCLSGFAVTGLGFAIAWRMESTQGFHAIMNLVLMPMLVLSGAFFPPSGSATWLRWIMSANPMTYSVSLFRHTLYLDADLARLSHGVSAWGALLATAAFAIVTFVVSIRTVTRHRTKALQ